MNLNERFNFQSPRQDLNLHRRFCRPSPKPIRTLGHFVELPGFEPRASEPKSDVLPTTPQLNDCFPNSAPRALPHGLLAGGTDVYPYIQGKIPLWFSRRVPGLEAKVL